MLVDERSREDSDMHRDESWWRARCVCSGDRSVGQKRICGGSGRIVVTRRCQQRSLLVVENSYVQSSAVIGEEVEWRRRRKAGVWNKDGLR